MRISDWSSDVCSSDLLTRQLYPRHCQRLLANLAVSRIFHGSSRLICWRRQSPHRSTGSSAICLDARSSCRSEEQTSELQSLMRISYAVFGLNKKKYSVIIHIPLILQRSYVISNINK